MCSGPVSTTTELGPITGATGEAPAPDGATSAGLLGVWLNRTGEVVPGFSGREIDSLSRLLA